jgi:hypothetical protein
MPKYFLKIKKSDGSIQIFMKYSVHPGQHLRNFLMDRGSARVQDIDDLLCHCEFAVWGENSGVKRMI